MKVGLLLGTALFLAASLAPAPAHAKGIPLVYNTGQEAFETGPLPPPFDQEKELEGFKAGYMCDIKGVLWSYFSVSNCKPVAFKDDTYSDEPELVKAITAKYKESDMKRGVWGSFGWMGIAGLVVVGIGIAIKEKVTGS